jgi:hypothetical protein
MSSVYVHCYLGYGCEQRVIFLFNFFLLLFLLFLILEIIFKRNYNRKMNVDVLSSSGSEDVHYFIYFRKK